ncbi:MAG: hypothetical protein JRG81_17885 [Deltaproteobacteria bacterium]|nr:hypothetical protein [Deltaproteobacteria bacterium]
MGKKIFEPIEINGMTIKNRIGLAQIYELVTHLRQEAGKRQVNNPRIAMAENGGGTIGTGEAAMSIHIMEKS